MFTRHSISAAVVLAASVVLSTAASAQSVSSNPVPSVGTQQPTTLDRDVHQQDRIEQGLQNGQLSTREGAQLERDESRINAVQARDMSNGSISAAEQARLTTMQNHVSQDIHQDRNNDVRGNPNSVSSQRMQQDVQRNVNQQTRIDNGYQNGSLTTREASRLEGGQSRTDGNEYAAGRNGYVSGAEQRGIQRQDNRRSGAIYGQKHDRQVHH